MIRVNGCRVVGLWSAPALLLLVPAAGCEPSDGLVLVEGTIAVDGAAPESGQIDFFPAPGAGNPVGTKIVDGAYSVRAPVGRSRIEIRVPKVVGQKRLYDSPDSPVRDILAESLPENYNDQSELFVDVKPDGTVRDFTLTTTD